MIEIRTTRRADASAVARLAERGFEDSPDMKVWEEEDLLHHVDAYPDGQFVAVDDKTGKVVGSATSMRVPRDLALRRHTWREVSGGSNLANHRDDGDVLYGIDVVVHPRYRMGGVGRLLYEARENLLQHTDCVGFAAGGRLPNYHVFARFGMPPEEYVKLAEQRIIRDPVLGFQLKRGMVPLDVLPGYIADARSGNWACLIFHPNPTRPESRDLVEEYRRFDWAPPAPRARSTSRTGAPTEQPPGRVESRPPPRESGPARGRPSPRRRAQR